VRLRDVVDTFNQLAVADPALRQRDASRPGPQERSRAAQEIAVGGDIAVAAAQNRDITTPEAGIEVQDQIEVGKNAGDDLASRQSLELAAATQRNFFASKIAAVYRAARLATRGDGGFVSEEFFSGVYKAAGAATFAAAAVDAYGIRTEIMNFMLANADVLRAYAALAFEQSPGFKQMVDWLETHVPRE